MNKFAGRRDGEMVLIDVQAQESLVSHGLRERESAPVSCLVRCVT